MKFIKKQNDTISIMITLIIGFILFAIFAFFGSIQLQLTLIVIGILTLITISFCLGAYLEERDHKKHR